MQSQLEVFILPANFESDRIMPWPACQVYFKMAASKVPSLKAVTLTTLTSVPEKADCLLAVSEDKN